MDFIIVLTFATQLLSKAVISIQYVLTYNRLMLLDYLNAIPTVKCYKFIKGTYKV